MHYLVPVAVAVLTAAAFAVYAVHSRRHTRTLRSTLERERCTARLTDAAHHRDMAAFRRRLAAASAHQPHPDAHHALTQAEAIVDAALARHSNPREGGPS